VTLLNVEGSGYRRAGIMVLVALRSASVAADPRPEQPGVA
jgi:hypothetical protein